MGLAFAVALASSFAMSAAGGRRWMYPQMEMELYRVHEMRDDVRRMGLYAGHPGSLPSTRSVVSFRRKCAKAVRARS